jgi:thiol-disulfide isomerase/thioredoxin
MSENVFEIQAAQYEAEVLGAPEPVVVGFFSTECPPCEALASKLQAVADQLKGRVRFIRIFRQGNRDLAAKLAVTRSPTLLFYKGGKEVGSRLTGYIRRREIKRTAEAMLA